MLPTQLTAAGLVTTLESLKISFFDHSHHCIMIQYPVRYEGVVLVVRVRPVPVGHHGAEPLLEAVHGPRLVKV